MRSAPHGPRSALMGGSEGFSDVSDPDSGRVRTLIDLRWGEDRHPWVLVTSGPCDRPSFRVTAQPERRQSGPVERSGPGVEVGTDAFFASGAGSTSSPRFANEVGDLAFDDGSVAAVALEPAGFFPSARARCSTASWGCTQTARPARDFVHARRRGHSWQWILKDARPPPSRVG